MEGMFACTDYFNSDLSRWNIENVNDFEEMFYSSVFDQDISSWSSKMKPDARILRMYARCSISKEHQAVRPKRK